MKEIIKKFWQHLLKKDHRFEVDMLKVTSLHRGGIAIIWYSRAQSRLARRRPDSHLWREFPRWEDASLVWLVCHASNLPIVHAQDGNDFP